MCNLYSLTTSQEAIRRIAHVMRDTTGNQAPLPGIFPDYEAPIVRQGADGARELVLGRWGMPGPPAFGNALVQRAQREEPALAALALAREPLPGTLHLVL